MSLNLDGELFFVLTLDHFKDVMEFIVVLTQQSRSHQKTPTSVTAAVRLEGVRWDFQLTQICPLHMFHMQPQNIGLLKSSSYISDSNEYLSLRAMPADPAGPEPKPGKKSGKFSLAWLAHQFLSLLGVSVKLQPGSMMNILVSVSWRERGGWWWWRSGKCTVLQEGLSTETSSRAPRRATSHRGGRWKQLPAPAAESRPSLCTSISIHSKRGRRGVWKSTSKWWHASRQPLRSDKHNLLKGLKYE